MPILGGALADRFGFRSTLAGAFFILAHRQLPAGVALRAVDGGRRARLLAALRAHAPDHARPRDGPRRGEARGRRDDGPRGEGERPLHRLLDLLHGRQHRGLPRARSSRRRCARASASRTCSRSAPALTLAMAIVTLVFYREPEREPATTGHHHRRRRSANLVRVLGDVQVRDVPRDLLRLLGVFWQQYLTLAIYCATYVDPDANDRRAPAPWEALHGHPLHASRSNYLMRKMRPFIAIVSGVLISSLSWLFLTAARNAVEHRDRRARRARDRRGRAGAALLRVRLPPGAAGPAGPLHGVRLPPHRDRLLGGRLAGRTAAPPLRQRGKQPAHMWYVVAAVGVVTTVLLIAYDRLLRPKDA